MGIQLYYLGAVMELIKPGKRPVAKKRDLPTISDQQVGIRLQTIRKARGLTQRDMIKACNLGVTQQVYSKYENGGVRIPAINLFMFAQTLNVNIAEFFPHTSTPLSNNEEHLFLQRLLQVSLDKMTLVEEECKKQIQVIKTALKQ